MLLLCSLTLLLCTVFAANPNIEDGLLMGKVFWFHTAVLLLAVCCLVSVMWVKCKKLTLGWADVLILLFALLTLFTYRWTLNPDPEKLLFMGQWVILWFLLKIICAQWESFRQICPLFIIGIGIIEALYGACQLYGVVESCHSQFKMIGSFYNPGPFSGYLAVILPLSVDMILQYRDVALKKGKLWCYAAWFYGMLAVILLPAGMSRTAWIAALISCGWVYWQRKVKYEVVVSYAKRHRVRTALIGLAGLFIVFSVGMGAYEFKKDSANGRLLLWKLTGKIITEHPLAGTGLGGFRSAYATTQANYFASGDASRLEQEIAGTPNFGFNDLLQMGAEQGVATMSVFILLLAYSIYRGSKNRQIGVTGSLIALVIFSLASYPLQYPEFWILLSILLAMIHVCSANTFFVKAKVLMAFSIILGIASLSCYIPVLHYYSGYKQWRLAKVLHNRGQYELSDKLYQTTALHMRHRPELLSEVAFCYIGNQQYAKANQLLYRAMSLCADPTFYYVTAQNEQTLGNYVRAEQLLQFVIAMLPNRIYPHYLLVKLYSEPKFFQKDKRMKAAEVVLTKSPKVDSPAIKEMREYVLGLNIFSDQISKH